MTSATPIVRQAGEGERMWFAGGGAFTWKATSEETGGSFVMLEDDMVRGKTTPLHRHPGEDEAIYVLEGELLAHVDGDEHVVGAGGLLMVPRGVPHAFLVTSPTARVLVVVAPGSGERFFRAAGEPAATEEEASRPPDFARLEAAAKSTGALEILGPPPFRQAAPA